MLKQRLNEFLESLPHEATRKKYSQYLREAMEFGITERGIVAWVGAQRNRGVMDSSIKSRMAAVKSFLRWLNEPKYESVYTSLAHIKLKITHKQKLIPEDREVELAIYKASHKPHDYLLMLLLADLGLRAHEAIDIRPEHVDFSHHRVEITRKGGSTQLMPMTHRVESAIKQIVSRNVGDGTLLRMSYPTAYERVRKYLGVNPHAVRRTAATKFQRDHKDLTLTQKFLGHAHAYTTELYIMRSDEELANAMRGGR